MKQLEIDFFLYCIKELPRSFYFKDKYLTASKYSVWDLLQNFLQKYNCSEKQLMYYVNKWSSKGIYNYGVNLYFGWFEYENFYEEYKKIFEINESDIKNSWKKIGELKQKYLSCEGKLLAEYDQINEEQP